METLDELILKSGQTYLTTLNRSGLRPDNRKWHENHFNELPLFYRIVEGLMSDHDREVQKTTRTTERLSFISHELHAKYHYFIATESVRRSETAMLDAFIEYVIRHHDTPEELSRLELKRGTRRTKEEVQKHHVDDFCEKTYDAMRRTLLTTGTPERDIDDALREMHLGIDVKKVLVEVMDKLTPGNKTPEFQTQTYIDVLHRILQTGSDESKYIAILAKVGGDRPHNGDTLYADLRELQKAVGIGRLWQRAEELDKAARKGPETYRAKKIGVEGEFIELNRRVGIEEMKLKRFDPQERYASVERHGRMKELYKTFLTVNETLRFLEETDNDERHHAGTLGELRIRLVEGLDHLLVTQQRIGMQEALVRAIYFPVSVKDSVWKHRTPKMLYNEMSEAAKMYTNSTLAQHIQHTEGNTKEDVFNGTLRRLTAIERNEPADKPIVETYRENYLLQMQDAVILETYANTLREELSEYKLALSMHRGNPAKPRPTFEHFTRIRTSMSEALERAA